MRLAPLAALARHLYLLQRNPFDEESRALGFGRKDHEFAILSSEGSWSSASAVISELDARSRPGANLLSSDASVRRRELQRITDLHDLVAAQSQRVLLFHTLGTRKTAVELATAGAPRWQRRLVSLFYPLWRRRVVRRYGLTADRIERDLAEIREGFRSAADTLEAEAGSRSGKPTIAELAFAYFAAPVLLPDRYAVTLPRPEACTKEFFELVQQMRSHLAGEAALRLLESEAAKELAVVAPEVRKLKGRGVLRNPALVLAVVNLGRRFAPVLRVGKFAALFRHQDLRGALNRDADFQIGPINARRIHDVNHGPFILGLDPGAQHAYERQKLYAAYRAYDVDRVHALVHHEANRLLDGATARGGKIECVNSYARLVAARSAVILCGVPGPSEADLTRVIRRMFHHTFLNQKDKKAVKDAAVAASLEFKAWFEDEVRRRRSGQVKRDDLLGRMLEAESNLSDPAAIDLIRRNITGLAVGAIDTTATTVANILHLLLTRPKMRRQAEADIEYPVRFRSWCWEVLRFSPHNPLVMRRSAHQTEVAGKEIGGGKQLLAMTLGAMHDPAAFHDPKRLVLGRPEENYMHFGSGIHTCAGREFNRVQVPELVRLLLLRNPVIEGEMLFDGPFPDELIVRLRAGNSGGGTWITP